MFVIVLNRKPGRTVEYVSRIDPYGKVYATADRRGAKLFGDQEIAEGYADGIGRLVKVVGTEDRITRAGRLDCEAGYGAY